MSTVPDGLHFAKTHEWVRVEEDGSVTIGLSDHAQEQLGDLVYVELPDVGRQVSPGEEVAVVESVKAASDIYAPVAGEVTATNDTLSDAPETVNADPYGEGWLFRLEPTNVQEVGELLDAEEYAELAEAESS